MAATTLTVDALAARARSSLTITLCVIAGASDGYACGEIAQGRRGGRRHRAALRVFTWTIDHMPKDVAATILYALETRR